VTDPYELKALLESHPNARSKHRSPTSLAIDAHYAGLCLADRWTWERYTRLAAFLRLTVFELASLALIPHARIDRWRRDFVFPFDPDVAYAHAMILTLIESNVLREYTKDVIANPFPTSANYDDRPRSP
jgi:hypothetical protein